MTTTTVLHILGVWFVISVVFLMAWVAVIELAGWWRRRHEPEPPLCPVIALYPTTGRRVQGAPQKPPTGGAA